jgi:hypothetical protein
VLSHRPTDIDAKINLEITLRELDSTPGVAADTSQNPKDQTKNSNFESPDDASDTGKPKASGQSGSDGESGIKAAIGAKGNKSEAGDAGDQVAIRQVLDDIFQETVISLSKLEALEILDLVTEENREINYPYTSSQGLIVKQ